MKPTQENSGEKGANKSTTLRQSSGKRHVITSLRIPEELHKRIKEVAEEMEWSDNTFHIKAASAMIELIEQAFGQEKVPEWVEVFKFKRSRRPRAINPAT